MFASKVNHASQQLCIELYSAPHMKTKEGNVYYNRMCEWLNQGADPSIPWENNNTYPIHLATHKGYFPIIQTILAHHPHQAILRDERGNTPLHLAAISFSINTLSAVLPYAQKSYNVRNRNNETPIELLIKNLFPNNQFRYDHYTDLADQETLLETERLKYHNNQTCLKMLDSTSAYINLPSDEIEKILRGTFYCLSEKEQGAYIAFLQKLRSHFLHLQEELFSLAKILSTLGEGKNEYSSYCEQINHTIEFFYVKILLTYEIQSILQDELSNQFALELKNAPPMSVDSEGRHLKRMLMWLQKGADPCKRINKGHSYPIHLAAQKGYYPVAAEICRKSPQQANQPDGKKNTPLHFAVCSESLETLQVLAPFTHRTVNCQNWRGETPLSSLTGKSATFIQSVKRILQVERYRDFPDSDTLFGRESARDSKHTYYQKLLNATCDFLYTNAMAQFKNEVREYFYSLETPLQKDYLLFLEELFFSLLRHGKELSSIAQLVAIIQYDEDHTESIDHALKAAIFGKEENLYFLLALGANPHASIQGKTAYELAVELELSSIIKIFDSCPKDANRNVHQFFLRGSAAVERAKQLYAESDFPFPEKAFQTICRRALTDEENLIPIFETAMIDGRGDALEEFENSLRSRQDHALFYPMTWKACSQGVKIVTDPPKKADDFLLSIIVFNSLKNMEMIREVVNRWALMGCNDCLVNYFRLLEKSISKELVESELIIAATSAAQESNFAGLLFLLNKLSTNKNLGNILKTCQHLAKSREIREFLNEAIQNPHKIKAAFEELPFKPCLNNPYGIS